MSGILCNLAIIYLLAIFGRILFTWIPISPDSPVAVVQTILVRVTEPVLGPLRRALPPLRIGNFAIDLSPIIVIIALQIVMSSGFLGC